ncbi:hypothetical protein J4730_21085 [Klebsiella pneumoniae]|uniref:Uncharacterized protein n=1 Tax=Klebsiella pneumoniae TaxID=573 RepID=A0A939NSG3_KLEPN|nr:hypothetical protein [Klebsiella pneumoniae]
MEAETGETILDAALRSGIEIEHACENPVPAPPATASCVKVLTRWRKVAKMKTTCWIKLGLEPDSRLSCRARHRRRSGR